MSKVISAVIILLILSTPIFSQGYQNVLKDAVSYLTPEEEAFMIDKKSTYLFKLYPYSSSLANVVNRQGLSFAFEKKLLKAFSVSLLADFPQAIDWQSPLKSKVSESTFFRGGIELRYYYKMASLLEKGKQANNLSSNYFGVKLERGWFIGETSIPTQ